jgi:hypothetical protein
MKEEEVEGALGAHVWDKKWVQIFSHKIWIEEIIRQI